MRRVLSRLKRLGLVWLMVTGALIHVGFVYFNVPSVEVRPLCTIEWPQSRRSVRPEWAVWNGMDLEVQGTMTEAYVDELVERMRFYGLFPVRIGRTILIAPNEDISYVAKSNGESLIALAARTPLPENIRQKISRLERPWDIDSDCDVVRALAIEPAERAP